MVQRRNQQAPSVQDAIVTAQQHREAVVAEYGTYVATEPIDILGVRAFNTGDPVPVGHVDKGLVPEESVAKTSTQAGEAAVDEAAASV